MGLLICGFQSGADIGGARAAKALQWKTGGYMPKHFMTEDGPRPQYREEFGAMEMQSTEYPVRTEANVRWAACILLFGDQDSRGSLLVRKWGKYLDVPILPIEKPRPIGLVSDWLSKYLVDEDSALMVAGNRESSKPGIGERVETYMRRLLDHIEIEGWHRV